MDDQPSWVIERSTGPAQPLHGRDLRDLTAPTALVHRVTAPAVVLGSRQTHDVLNTEFLEPPIEIATRRSGGGLVVLEPEASVWIDLVLPRTHRLWDDDVNRSFLWVGELWKTALADVGFAHAFVHNGPLVNRSHGEVVCFAGLGPGEVLLPAANPPTANPPTANPPTANPPTTADSPSQNSQPPADAAFKVVGLSQRRTRHTARFQCLAVIGWSPELLRSLVSPAAMPDDLVVDDLKIGFPSSVTPPSVDTLTNAVLAHLP